VADELLTPRLRLRRWRADDLGALAEIFAKEEVWRFPFGRGLTPDETAAFLDRRLRTQELRGSSPAAAEDRATGKLIGYIGLSVPEWLPEVLPAVEIGWRLDPPSWGRGLATEGAQAALAHAFTELRLSQVISIYKPENVASGRVMEHLGMALDHETRHPVFALALRVLRLTRGEWEVRGAR